LRIREFAIDDSFIHSTHRDRGIEWNLVDSNVMASNRARANDESDAFLRIRERRDRDAFDAARSPIRRRRPFHRERRVIRRRRRWRS